MLMESREERRRRSVLYQVFNGSMKSRGLQCARCTESQNEQGVSQEEKKVGSC